MKKLLSVVLILALVLGMTGCSDDNASDADNTASEEPLKVGFIYIGSANDGGFSQAHAEGAKAMIDHFKGKVEGIEVENVSDADKQGAMTVATGLIDQGCKVIVGCSYGYMDAFEELASNPDYKDIKFLHFSGNKMNDTNFGNYFGATEEPRYLTGIIAGMMTKTNKLGYVAAYPYTEVQIGINAFTLGAQSVNPDVEVKVVYINSWYNPEQERAAADELLKQDCDIITQHCDTTGPQVAAAEKGKLAIGYNMDNSQVVPKSFLTAAVWNHEAFLNDAIQDILDGNWKPESYYGHMKDNYMDIAKMTDLVPQEVQDKVNEEKAKILSGELQPFSGKILYNDGTVLCEEGQTLDRAQIWSIDKLVKGATGVE